MTAIGMSVAGLVSTIAIVKTSDPTVGEGKGYGNIVTTGPTILTGILIGALYSSGMTGTGVPPLSSAIAKGIIKGLEDSVVTVDISGGAITPNIPSAGIGIGKLI
jgi:hypothetical protein